MTKLIWSLTRKPSRCLSSYFDALTIFTIMIRALLSFQEDIDVYHIVGAEALTVSLVFRRTKRR